jgi:hypothetical protein
MNIKNCKIKYRCPKTWDNLTETKEPAIKYCKVCDKGVHYCSNKSDLEHATKQGWCVAMNVTDDEDENITHKLLGDIVSFPYGKT